MKINIHAVNMELTDAIRDYAEKKVSKLSKFIDESGDREVVVELDTGKNTNHHQSGDVFFAKAVCEYDGHVFTAQETHIDLYGALDLMVDELERQVRQSSEKKRDTARRDAAKAKDMLHSDEEI